MYSNARKNQEIMSYCQAGMVPPEHIRYENKTNTDPSKPIKFWKKLINSIKNNEFVRNYFVIILIY